MNLYIEWTVLSPVLFRVRINDAHPEHGSAAKVVDCLHISIISSAFYNLNSGVQNAPYLYIYGLDLLFDT